MKFIKIYLILILLSLQSIVTAQTSSSYSRFGVGDMVYSYSSRKIGMGIGGISVIDNAHISLLNPASLTGIKLTRTEFAANLNGQFISDQNKEKYYNSGGFDGFTVVFPVSTKNGITLAMGILPFSNVSYLDVTKTPGATFADDYVTTFKGDGGLSKLFVGSSLKLPFGFSLGVTMDYYFGSITYISRIEFPLNTNKLTSEFENKKRPNGFGSTIGVITPDISKIFSSGTISDLRLGVSVNFFTNITSDSILIRRSSIGTDTLSFKDVILDIPTRIFAGLSFRLNNEYLFTLDYTRQNWKNYRFSNVRSPNLKDSYRYSFGIEHDNRNSAKGFYKEHFIWRTGVSYEKTLYQFNGEDIKQYAAYAGFSVPLSVGNSLDVGLQFAIRGTTASNLIREKRLKLSFGLSLGELWFIRRNR